MSLRSIASPPPPGMQKAAVRCDEWMIFEALVFWETFFLESSTMLRVESLEMAQGTEPRGRIVLVHGLATPRWVLQPLVNRLTAYRYEVLPWYYPSLHHKIEYHAQRLRDDLVKLTASAPVHLVAHSMGSVVSGMALSGSSQLAVGRMVWLAPPVYGSPIAALMAPFLGWAIPAVRQLIRPKNGMTTIPHLRWLPETGIIAGRLDWLVPPSRTRLPHASYHLTIASTHNHLLFSPHVVKEIHSFLSMGVFTSCSTLT